MEKVPANFCDGNFASLFVTPVLGT
jgi:hypothetical protein